MQVTLSAAAQRDLARLESFETRRIVEKFEEYEASGEPLRYAKRLHQDPEGTHRFRIGDWRAKLVIEKSRIVITHIKHRSDAYR